MLTGSMGDTIEDEFARPHDCGRYRLVGINNPTTLSSRVGCPDVLSHDSGPVDEVAILSPQETSAHLHDIYSVSVVPQSLILPARITLPCPI